MRRFIELTQADVCKYIAEALNRRATPDAQVTVAFITGGGSNVRFAVDELRAPEAEPDKS